MLNQKRRKKPQNRLNIVVGCWNDSIGERIRQVAKDGMMQGFDVGVKICIAKPADHLWLDRQ